MREALQHFDLMQPWWLLALPLPWLVYRLVPPARVHDAALRVPFFAQLRSLSGPSRPALARHRWLLPGLCWLLLVFAAAAPRWEGSPVTLPTSGRELMLAVDISGSMQIEDMLINDEPVSRLVAVKAVLADFIERRRGDRLGLILFGSEAHVQAPLTFDHTTVVQFMLEAQLGFAGPETAIGDAIGLAIKRLRERPGDRHVLILLSDGANNAGQVSPIAAAELAASQGIVIYTVGLGADRMVIPGLFGSRLGARQVNPSADLDESALEKIAELTGGRYFRARDPAQLAAIYAELDQLEPVPGDGDTVRPLRSLAHWPLGLALVLSMIRALLFVLPTLQRRVT